MRASLVIPTYNRNHILCQTVLCALQQDFSNYEILLVDQSERHDRDTTEFLCSLPRRARVILHKPPSLPGARNRGIREAKGDIIIMIDDDVVMDRDFVSEHVRCYGDPEIAFVTGRITQDARYVNRVPFFFRSEFLKWFSSTNFQGREPGEAYRLAGGNFSGRKDAMLEVGLFDEHFIGTAWGEEYDFSLRVRRRGLRIRYHPGAHLHHLNAREGGCGSRSRFDADTVYSKAHNLAYLIEKNRVGKTCYPYLLWYIYKQVLIKKDYISIRGARFLPAGHVALARGFLDGFVRGRRKAL